ncbi:MAG: hypothetical protein HW410_1428 [Nitrosarchaeum sp.]|nr:hypothetical protein [Nitrosarchaeum sp.]
MNKISKEEYLNGEKKEKVLDIFRYYFVTRRINEEMIELLKNKGFPIAEQTLRRFKSEIYDKSGDTAQVFRENVGAILLDGILSYNEMVRQCWKIFDSSTTVNKKIKALSTSRSISAEKLNILKKYSMPNMAKVRNYSEEALDQI